MYFREKTKDRLQFPKPNSFLWTLQLLTQRIGTTHSWPYNLHLFYLYRLVNFSYSCYNLFACYHLSLLHRFPILSLWTWICSNINVDLKWYPWHLNIYFLQSHGKPSKLIKRLTCENFIYAFYALSFLTSALEMASGLWCIRIIRRIGESIVPNWQGICTWFFGHLRQTCASCNSSQTFSFGALLLFPILIWKCLARIVAELFPIVKLAQRTKDSSMIWQTIRIFSYWLQNHLS